MNGTVAVAPRASSIAIMEALENIRRALLVVLTSYFLSRIIIAYMKMQEGNIGTLFNRINSPTVQVDNITCLSQNYPHIKSYFVTASKLDTRKSY